MDQNPDPFALARAGEPTEDGELFALIAEYWRIVGEMGVVARAATCPDDEDDEEINRLGELAIQIKQKIADFEPKTLPGILAGLEYSETQHDYPDYFPDGALAGLRAIVERGPLPT